jgi:hypothetical protein
LVGTKGGTSYSVQKINFDGSIDTTFSRVPDSTMFWVNYMALEYDGKVLVTGHSMGGPSYYRQKIIRLNTNGTINQTVSDVEFGYENTVVYSILTQADGKFYLNASPYFFSATSTISFARFNNNGTLDASFQSGQTVGGAIGDMILDGNSIIFAGAFTEYNGISRNRIVRVNSSGNMAANQYDALANDVFAFKNGNALQVESLGKAITQVSVYDLSGRLLSDTGTINTLKTSVDDISPSNKILIVNIKLADNTTVSKKIYY